MDDEVVLGTRIVHTVHVVYSDVERRDFDLQAAVPVETATLGLGSILILASATLYGGAHT